MLSKISQSEKDKHHITPPTCGIQKHGTHRNHVEWRLPGAETGEWRVSAE